MDHKLQKNFYEKYPELFSNKDKTPMESCMVWGIECGDGWYNILDSLCYMIKQHEENIQDRKNHYPDEKVEYFPVKFDQVKEKYGGLRVYFSGGDDYVEGLVSMAESISYKTCEVCGSPGKPNDGGWISTLCDAHRRSI